MDDKQCQCRQLFTPTTKKCMPFLTDGEAALASVVVIDIELCFALPACYLPDDSEREASCMLLLRH